MAVPGVYKWGGGIRRRERQFAVNWIIRDRVSPTRRTLNSFPISRFETNLKSRQQTSQNENPSAVKNKIFFYFFILPKKRDKGGGEDERGGVKGVCTPTRPFLLRYRSTQEREDEIRFERPCQYSHQMI